MLPFHISCKLPAQALYQLADGRFQLIAPGPIAPFMDGPGYLLVEQTLADYLAILDVPEVRDVPATILDRGTGQEFRTHRSLVINRFCEVRDIPLRQMTGMEIVWASDRYLFVSPALKAALEKEGFSYLEFSEGLRRFAGATA